MNYTETWNAEFQKNTTFMERNQAMAMLEIGTFEGLTANYIVENLLAHNGKLICIDPLDSDYALDGDGSLFEGQYQRFIENTEAHKERITLIRDKSTAILPLLRDESYEFIYIDGDHTYNSVYFDGTEAFRICKVGGYILFDDYLWGNVHEVQKAVDLVLHENKNYKLLLKLNQVLIQKLETGSETEDGQDRYQELTVEKLFSEDKIHAAYTNLDSRPDRNENMIAELKRVGFNGWFQRQRSFPWLELYSNYSDAEKEKVQVMYKRTPGALGCQASQVEVMKEALRQGKHAWVNEDDLCFCSDISNRLKIIYKFLNQHDWDIFWMGGTYHIEPTWHKSIEGKHIHPDMGDCKCNLNRDWEETNNPYIVRTYGAFSTHSWIVNKDRIQHILDLIERRTPISMGIDFLLILEQPNLNTFAFNPGCVKQIDSMSDISNAFATQSGFAELGIHWFSDSMNK